MHWIIQQNLFREEALLALVEAVRRRGLGHSLVDVVPFGGGIRPPIQARNPCVVMGSTQLSKIALQQDWRPGAFLNDRFQVAHWTAAYTVLNPDAAYSSFGALGPDIAEFFLRPLSDEKEFVGRVVTREELREWQRRVRDLGADNRGALSLDTPVMIATVKEIHAETRCVIVNRKVVTASLYRRGQRVIYSDQVDRDVVAFAEEQAARWVPHVAFVMDVARTPLGLRIVEINCLNSAGLYACDVGKIVDAISELGEVPLEFRAPPSAL